MDIDLVSPESCFYGLLVLLVLITAIPIWLRWKRRRLDIFEPPVFQSLYCLLAFGISSIPHVQGWLPMHRYLTPAGLWLPRALSAVVVAVFCLWIGYSAPLPGLERRRQPDVYCRHEVKVSWIVVLSGLGIILRLLLIGRGYFAYLMVHEAYFDNLAESQTLGQLSILGQVGFVLAAIGYFQHPRSPSWRVLYFASLFIEIVFGLVSGMKSQVLFPLLLTILIYSYMRDRVPVRYLLLTAVVLAVLSPINKAYRRQVLSGDLDRTDVYSAVTATVDVASETQEEGGFVEMLSDGGLSLSQRFDLLSSVAHAMRYIDETGELWVGRTYIYLPAMALVPRFLWSDKPVTEMAYWFSYAVLKNPKSMYHGEAITLPGDLYINFGWAGICGGFLVLGVLQRMLYRRSSLMNDPSYLIVYAPLWLSCIQLESDVLSSGAGALKLLLLLLVIRRFAFTRRIVTGEPGRDVPFEGSLRTHSGAVAGLSGAS